MQLRLAAATAAPSPLLQGGSNPERQFMKDRCECLQDAEQRVSGAYVNAYGGAASSQVVPSCGVWVSCLGARGYVVDPNGDLAAPPGMMVRCR
jgi:hypothetical protein